MSGPKEVKPKVYWNPDQPEYYTMVFTNADGQKMSVVVKEVGKL